MNVSTTGRLASAGVLCFAAAFAQTPGAISGQFVVAEEGFTVSGQAVAALSLLTFSGSGSVSGRQYSQGAIRDVQGVYTSGVAGFGSLVLNVTGPGGEGDSATSAAAYRVIVAPGGDIAAVRVDPGSSSTARIVAAGPLTARGAYLLNQRPSSRKFVRVALLTFDGTGSVSGIQVIDTQSGAAESNIAGSVAAMSDGFQTLSLASSITSENGDAETAREEYVVLNTSNELFAIASAPGPAQLLVLER